MNGGGAADFLKEDIFNQKLEQLRKGYISFFEKIHVLKPDTKIFIHGYDYIRSAPDAKTIKNGWANRYMIAAGIKDAGHREVIIRHLVDTFNNMLKGFMDDYPYVRYVDHRGTVQLNEWMDEIHPNNTGYQKVANNFLKAMQSV
jgi:lysophospholipase L1-like esterase